MTTTAAQTGHTFAPAASRAESPTAQELHPFLAATPMCDAGNELIRETAVQVTAGAATQREAATALFLWVRDQVEYTMGDWNWKASESLRLRRGTCSNKANLMVAMARSLGIPAGFHVQFVSTDSYFRGSFIPLIQRSVRDKAIHVYVTLWLDGRWVKCDPTDDKALCDAVEAIVPHATVLDFDGVHDAVLPFREGSILSDRGPLSDIDADLCRVTRLVPAQKQLFARFVSFMRDHGARYRQPEDSVEQLLRIEREFLAFLADVEPATYAELFGVPEAAA